MKEIGVLGGQGTNPPLGPKKSDVVAYCLVSMPHRGQVLTSPLLQWVIHVVSTIFAMSPVCLQFWTYCGIATSLIDALAP